MPTVVSSDDSLPVITLLPMIITSENEVLKLSGSLVKNQWMTIRAAADLLLTEHPEGIIIDCRELTNVSEAGARTFLDAVRHIEAAGARIVVCNLPDNVLQVIRSVPGVRSQLPIASSLEEARASLQLSGAAATNGREEAGGIVVPLMAGLDGDYAVAIAALPAHALRLTVYLVYLLVVGRSLPLNTPLSEEEAEANQLLEQAEQVARRHNLTAVRRVERVRDAEEGILHVIRSYGASHVVLGAVVDHSESEDDRIHSLVDALLLRAPCNVLIGRRSPTKAAEGRLSAMERAAAQGARSGYRIDL